MADKKQLTDRDSLSPEESEEFERELQDMYDDIKQNAAISDDLMHRLQQDFPQPERNPWWQWLTYSGAVSAMAGLLLIVWFRPWSQPFQSVPIPRPPIDTSWRSKSNQPVIKLYVARPSEVPRVRREVTETTMLQEDDWLQFELMSPRQWYLVVFSLNDKGIVERYAPHKGASALIPTGRSKLPSDGVLVLDGSIGKETLFVFGAPTPWNANALKQTLQGAFDKANRQLTKTTIPESKKWRLLWSITFTKRKKP